MADSMLIQALQDPEFYKSMGRGLTNSINRGLIGALAGAPVDIANTALKPFGIGSEKPVMGSEWIGDKMQQAGMVSGERNPMAEGLAGFIDPATMGTGAAKLAGSIPAIVGMAKGAGKASDAISAQTALRVPNNAWLESEIRKQYAYTGRMPSPEEITKMANEKRVELEKTASGNTINKSKSAQVKLAVNDYQDVINNAHKNENLQFTPLPENLIDNRNVHVLHQSNSYGGKPGSSYHIQMVDGEPVYVRTADHWGEFGTRDVSNTGEDIYNSYKWDLPNSEKGKRQSGYIKIIDLLNKNGS